MVLKRSNALIRVILFSLFYITTIDKYVLIPASSFVLHMTPLLSVNARLTNRLRASRLSTYPESSLNVINSMTIKLIILALTVFIGFQITCASAHVPLLHIRFKFTSKINWLTRIIWLQHVSKIFYNDVCIIIGLHKPICFVPENI